MNVRIRSMSWLIILTTCCVQIGCDGQVGPAASVEGAETEAAPETETGGGVVVATVNGTDIYERDVRYWMERNTRGRVREPTPEQRRNMLEAIISQELILQRATELGLDQDRQYQERLMAKQAELDSLRRTSIRDLYYSHQAMQVPSPTDDEVRRFYEANAALIGSTYHIQHILERSEADIEAVRQRLETGASFEEVAEEPFASLPGSAARPWDRRDLAWQQVPELWRASVATLEVGGVTDVISGPNERYWIVRMVSREEDPSVTFEGVREDLRTMLQRDASEQLRANLDETLREGAQIDYVTTPDD